MNRRRASDKHAVAVRDGIKAALCGVFGGQMHAEWYQNIAETSDQAALLLDIDRATMTKTI